MSRDEWPKWAVQLNDTAIGKDIPGVGMVYGLSIKIDASGVLVVVKAKGGGGHVVAFVGGRSLEACARKMQPVLTGEGGKWREDQYA